MGYSAKVEEGNLCYVLDVRLKCKGGIEYHSQILDCMGLRDYTAIKDNGKICMKGCESSWTSKQHFSLVWIQMQKIIAHPMMETTNWRLCKSCYYPRNLRSDSCWFS